jgi:hypothetical protein
MKGITNGDIIIAQSKSCGAAAASIVSMKPTSLRTINTLYCGFDS